MRILLFSDIHGNAAALEAVLSDSARHGAFDLTICAGDLAWAGPHPDSVLAIVRRLCGDDPMGSRGTVCLLGNCDLFLLEAYGQALPPGKERLRFHRQRRWMLDRLSPADLDFLRGMPFSHRVSPARDQDLLVVHANPRNLDDPLYPDLTDEEIEVAVGDLDARVLAFGHIHIPFVRPWRSHLLVNVASVGLPRDGDPRAAYSVLTWTGSIWEVAQYRVDYDIQRVAADMRSGGLPRGKHFATRLLAARYD